MSCFLSQTVFPVANCIHAVCLLLTRGNCFWLMRLFMLFYPQNQNCPLVQHCWRLSFTTGSRFGAGHCPAPQAAADPEQEAAPMLCRTAACSSLQKAQSAFSPESEGLFKALSPNWTAGILHGFAVHQELHLGSNEFLSCGNTLLKVSKK